MKRIICLTLTVIQLLICVKSFGETLTTYGGTFLESNNGFQEFREENPDVQLDWLDADYYPASAFVSALLTREFNCDLFIQRTDQADWKTLMSKGYCVDLSESKIISSAIRDMYPAIAAEGKINETIYAIPVQIGFSYFRANAESWSKMGFLKEDIPQSFAEFLHFLISWCERIENEPEPDVVALGGWEGSFTSYSCTNLLVQMLIDEIIMEKQYAGEELFFFEDELIGLLDECVEVGEKLSRFESKAYSETLFEQFASKIWPESAEYIVYLNINDSMPKLIKSRLSMWAINKNSSNIELSVKLLEKAAVGMTNPAKSDDLFIYQSSNVRTNPNYEADKKYWEEKIEDVIIQLQNEELDITVREALKESLSIYNDTLNRIEANKFLVSPDQLQDYTSVAERLYFAPINIFDSSEDGFFIVEDLCKQFSYRKINSRQFIQKLNSIATMMYLEQAH